MGTRPTVPPEQSGDDDDLDDFDLDTLPLRHRSSRADRPLKKLRREDEPPGPRSKRDGHPARPSKREQRWDEG